MPSIQRSGPAFVIEVTKWLSLDTDALGETVDWMARQRALWGRMFNAIDEYLKEDVPQ
jgi:hypothetical protein